MTSRNSDETTGDDAATISRRNVMKATGAAAVGSIGFAGTANAHDACGVFFCGCGRVVAHGKNERELPGTYPVIVAKEGKGGTSIGWAEAHGRGDYLEFVQKGAGKILAVVISDLDHEDSPTVWCNPNTCAQKVFERFGGERKVFEQVDPYETIDVEGCHRDGRKGHCGPDPPRNFDC